MISFWSLVLGYTFAGILTFCWCLHMIGWDNANQTTGSFYLADADVGWSAVGGLFWPVFVVGVIGVTINTSAKQGTLRSVVEGRPPKKMRKDILRKKIDADHRALGIGE